MVPYARQIKKVSNLRNLICIVPMNPRLANQWLIINQAALNDFRASRHNIKQPCTCCQVDFEVYFFHKILENGEIIENSIPFTFYIVDFSSKWHSRWQLRFTDFSSYRMQWWNWWRKFRYGNTLGLGPKLKGLHYGRPYRRYGLVRYGTWYEFRSVFFGAVNGSEFGTKF